jgi:hypothetical protein
MRNAARHLQESVDAFERLTGTLVNTIAGGGRSAWGLGLIGMAMDGINERVGQATRHLSDNLSKTSASMRTMSDQVQAAEQANLASIHVRGIDDRI